MCANCGGGGGGGEESKDQADRDKEVEDTPQNPRRLFGEKGPMSRHYPAQKQEALEEAEESSGKSENSWSRKNSLV